MKRASNTESKRSQRRSENYQSVWAKPWDKRAEVESGKYIRRDQIKCLSLTFQKSSNRICAKEKTIWAVSVK